MVIYYFGKTEKGKKRRVEETREYYERLVNMEPHLRYSPCWDEDDLLGTVTSRR